MPVTMVQNNQPGPTILAGDSKGSDYIEWAGSGDPSGGDIQPVPDHIVNSVAFNKAIRRGVLTTVNEDDERVQHALDAQSQSWDARTTMADQKALLTIENTQNNDMIVAKCIGPSPRGNGTCDIEVPVRDKTKDDRPALCSMHVELASQYVPEQTQEDGKVVVKWTRVTMGARQTADSPQ